MKRFWWRIISGVAVISLVVVFVVDLGQPTSPISSKVKRQLTSTLLMPLDYSVKIDRASVNYDGVGKLLVYNVLTDGTKIVVSEQPTPDQFVDIPGVFDKLVASMNEYKSFDVDVGTVHLTKPKSINGKQAAVLNAKGTLLFAKSEAKLSDDQWRGFFNHLQVQN